MNRFSPYPTILFFFVTAACLGFCLPLWAQAPSPAKSESPPSGGRQTSNVLTEAMVSASALVDNLQLDRLMARNSFQQWMMALAVACVGLVLGKVLAAMLRWLGRRFATRGWNVWQQLVADLSGPVSLSLFTLGLDLGALIFLDLREAPSIYAFWIGTRLLLLSIAILWYAYNLVGIVDVMVRRMTTLTGSALDQQLAPMIRKTLRVVLVVVGSLYIANNVFGQEVSTWLAGLGIAGLAVSLAAQDSLKGVFGSITILIDRPFRVGEAIKCSGYTGVVEEIGFRSTKVRTFAGDLVTLPNSNIVNEAIENNGRRPYLRRLFNVAIAHGTPPAKIQEALRILRSILEEPGIREPIHPVIGSEDFAPRVHFHEFNADSLNIQVIYWYAPPAYWDYLAHAERLNLRIFEEFEKAGIELACPTRTLYLAGDPKRQEIPKP